MGALLLRIAGPISNSYLLKGEKAVLVDTGAPGDSRRILAALRKHAVAPSDVRLILLTHGHSDHAGSAAELREKLQCPIAIHAADAGLARAGNSGVLAVQTTLGRVIRPFVNEPFRSFEPDIEFREALSLEPYGIKGAVVPTPGHTSGSSSVVLAGGEAIIGDLLRGSLLWPNRARPHFFCNDPEQNARSIARLARLGLLRCHPGHFGSFPGSELGRYLRTDGGELMEFSSETI
jgi:glyoxylase-like metal-dependent hydrolase (beta-lactamase superfamily II)